MQRDAGDAGGRACRLRLIRARCRDIDDAAGLSEERPRSRPRWSTSARRRPAGRGRGLRLRRPDRPVQAVGDGADAVARGHARAAGRSWSRRCRTPATATGSPSSSASSCKNLLNERQIIREMRERYLGETGVNPAGAAGPAVRRRAARRRHHRLRHQHPDRRRAAPASSASARNTEYRQDTVTVYLRAVSVRTGEVLTSVTASKTIASTGSARTPSATSASRSCSRPRPASRPTSRTRSRCSRRSRRRSTAW